MLPVNFQFVIAFAIPVLKEGNKRVLSKLVRKMTGREDERANVWMSLSLNIHYALFITIRLAGADLFTVISIIAIDFSFHLIFTYQVILIHNKVTPEHVDKANKKKDTQKLILKLVLAEAVEGIVPMAYAVGFMMAFYGPNAELIGNVGSGIWAYEAVNDIVGRLIVLFTMFGVDSLSVLLNTFCLSKFAHINLIQHILKVLKKYWMLLAIRIGYDLTMYFGFNDINLGIDMTTKFSWISDDGRMNFINCSTELTDEEKELLLSSFN